MEARDKVFIILAKKPVLYSNLSKILVEDGWTLTTLSEPGHLSNRLASNDKQTVCLAILGEQTRRLSRNEIDLIHGFASGSGSLFVASNNEQKDEESSQDLNRVISKYGIKFNQDSVIRPNLYKQYHPTEALLEDFIVNRGFQDCIRKHLGSKVFSKETHLASLGLNSTPKIIYANGCSLNVNSSKPIVVMSSSKWLLPADQAIGSIYRDANARVLVLGSANTISDAYLGKEDNEAFARSLIEFMSNKSFNINMSDAKTIEVPEPHIEPDLNQLVEMPAGCFLEPSELPKEKASLFDKRLFSVDNSRLVDLIEACKELNVSRTGLGMIKPELRPLPLKLEPATHGFLLRR